MGRTNAIMVAATKQHTGKSTVCLAFVAGLLAKKLKVGFLKPVGQEHVPVDVGKDKGVRVDRYETQEMIRHVAPQKQ